jgi:hypothetical protein
MKKLLLIGTVVLLTATSAQATFFAGPGTDSRGYPTGGGGATPQLTPRQSACMRAVWKDPRNAVPSVGTAAARRCLWQR